MRYIKSMTTLLAYNFAQAQTAAWQAACSLPVGDLS